MHSDKGANLYLVLILFLVALSTAAAYYRYIIKNDFEYFDSEDSVPARFDVNSYQL